MKNIKITLLLSLLLFTACSAEPTVANQTQDRGLKIVHKPTEVKQTEQRVALVIGNNNYSGLLSKLHNPINDAKSIKEILEQRGFEVIYSENSTKKSINESLKKFYEAIKKGGVGMFYFSGHGVEVDGKNYLIPVDANIKEKSDTEYEALPLDKITKHMQNIGNRLNIVVLDACRNDPFSRSFGTGGLAKTEPIGMFVAYSTGAGSVASDGKLGENGLFTSSLIKHMKEGLNLRDVFQKTRAEVYAKSNKQQFPAIYDQTINGNFYFTSPTSQTASTTQNTRSNVNSKSNSMRSTTLYSKKEQRDIIIDSKLKKSVNVSLYTSKVQNKIMEIVLDISNLTSKKLTLHYRVKWLDSEGFEVGENLSIWQPIFIEADESKRIKELSMVPNAHNYKIYFK